MAAIDNTLVKYHGLTTFFSFIIGKKKSVLLAATTIYMSSVDVVEWYTKDEYTVWISS